MTKGSVKLFSLLGTIFVLPGLIMGYGLIFGHNYASQQGVAASVMATVGIGLLVIAWYQWSEL